MAVGLTGFLQGLVSGGQARQQQQLERDQLALQTRQRDQIQAATLMEQINSLRDDDAVDEETTLEKLSQLGLDPQTKMAEMEGRRQRFEQRRNTLRTLANRPEILSQFGDVTGMLSPSRVAGPGFQMPKPQAPFADIYKVTNDIVTRATAATQSDKLGEVQRGRQVLEQMGAPQDWIDKSLPLPGAQIGGMPSATVAPRPLQDPAKFFQAAGDQFKPGVGGQRKLATGAIQKVEYKDGTPMVSYETPIMADYSLPEEKQAKIEEVRAKTNRITRLLGPEVNKAMASAELTKWKALEAKYNAEATPAIIKSKIAAKASNATADLRRLGLMLAHERGMMSLGMQAEGLQMRKSAAIAAQEQQVNDSIFQYDRAFQVAKTALGKAVTEGRSGEVKAQKELVQLYGAKLNELQRQRKAMQSGDDITIQSVIGDLIREEEIRDQSPYGMMGGMFPGMMGMQQPQQPINFSPMFVMPGGGTPNPAQGGGRVVTTAPKSKVDKLESDLGFRK
jgi:hypothetical protein